MPATYEPIPTTTLSSATNTVTFSSITNAYTDIVAVLNLRTSTGTDNVLARFNGDTGNNYSRTQLSGNGTTASSRTVANTNIAVFDNAAYLNTEYSPWIIYFMNYANTTTNKTILSRSNHASLGVDAGVVLWRNTAAINQITFIATSTNYGIGSTFTLYGILSA